MKEHKKNTLKLKKLGFNAYKEPIIYMREDCHVCQAEGFEAQARVKVELNNRSVIATINTIENHLLLHDEASLSNYTWQLLNAKEGETIFLSHPEPLLSLSAVRSKIYGNNLTRTEIESIIRDIASGQYSGIHIATFLTACAAGGLNKQEVLDLTHAMIQIGKRLHWPSEMVVDKHCVGGLPGNRTTLIIVPIVAAFGLMIPKTSSRAITSPAGTADTMEVLAPVDMDLSKMQRVVDREGGCIVWGGSVALSPADDRLIQIERAIDLDSQGQLVASILSKKIAAGSTHLLIDMPIGPTAKIRSTEAANVLESLLDDIGLSFGIKVKTVHSDGTQPIGRGIGPALEARDVLAVLQNKKNAPQDLKDRALSLAGQLLEFSPKVKTGLGKQIAKTILESGQAWQKFQAICNAQGGMREIPTARYAYDVVANSRGKVSLIDNRYIARIAKLAGAPSAKAAGVLLHVNVGTPIEPQQPLFTIYSESEGELNYALTLLKQNPHTIRVEQ